MPFEAPLLRPVNSAITDFGIHATGEHMAMIAIAGDCLIAFLRRHGNPRNDRLLTNVEMAKTADETHPIHLPGFLLEAADEQHGAIGGKFLFLAERGAVRGRVLRLFQAWFCR